MAILSMGLHDVSEFPFSTFYLFSGVLELICFFFMVDEGITYVVKEEVKLEKVK